MTTTEAKRIILYALACIVTIWLTLIFADEIDGTPPREQQAEAVHALQVQTIEQLRQDLNDCRATLNVWSNEPIYDNQLVLMPPVKEN